MPRCQLMLCMCMCVCLVKRIILLSCLTVKVCVHVLALTVVYVFLFCYQNQENNIQKKILRHFSRDQKKLETYLQQNYIGTTWRDGLILINLHEANEQERLKV